MTTNTISILAVAALLSATSAFADPQLTTTLGVSSCWEDSSITNGECQNYNHNQTAPTGPSLSDSQANSEDPWAHAAGSVQVFYGSCHMDGSSAALESQGAGILGNGSDNASATWNSQMTINSPGMDGQPATVRITLHASGDAAGSGSDPFGSFYVNYSYFVGDGQNGASYGGTFNANGWDAGGPPTRTFTFDATCAIGQPCEITHQASFSAAAGTGEPDFGDPQEANAQASGSLNFSSGGIQVLDPNDDNQPVSYTMTSNVGCGAGRAMGGGAPYAGFNVTNCAEGRIGSTFSLLDGTASAPTQVVATFVAPPPPSEIALTSDAVELTGTNSDPVMVQINYSAALAQAIFGSEAALRLVWKNPATQTWANAIAGNTGGVAQFFARAYNAATDFHVGSYGLDMAAKVAWAVVNHNSEFAVAAPLTLTSVVSEKTHGTAGNFDINMPLTGAPGVECRSSGPSNAHTLILTFANNLVSGNASVTSGTGTVASTPTISGNKMTVNLTGLTNAERVTVTLNNVKDVAAQLLPNTPVTVGFLLGDTNGSGSVTASDIGQTKAQSGQPVTAANFREDVNVSGSITASDIGQIKSLAGTVLPP